MDTERRRTFHGDPDLTYVAEIVGLAGVESSMRDKGFRDRHRAFDTVVGIDAQRGVNATSIANASGIPREAVRRKLKILLQSGYIIRKGRAHYVLKPGSIQLAERQAAYLQGFKETVLLMNELLGEGVVRWESPGRTPSRR